MKFSFTLFIALTCCFALRAQVSKDATVPVTASISNSPASVTLDFANPGNAGLIVMRRTKGQGNAAWIQLLSQSNSNLSTLTDNNVVAGQIYEYYVQRTVNGIKAHGYAHVAIHANPVNFRGKILIFVDSTNADALGVELVRLKNDMRGDGWWPIPFHTGPSSTVQSIKAQIVASYNQDPNNVKAVLLLGSVPVPYSGDRAWDGHTDHAGAWPCDAYYGDINGNWTDVTVNNTTPGRSANVNIPGDGKFDQSFLPSIAELQVGRVDFRHINAQAFGVADQIGLMKRYLDKDHKWRVGEYTVENKALVDDNFGYFSGEAFASNGFRNAYPLVGEENVVEADFFADTNPQSYLLGYGTGPGSYQSAGGVGSSADFAVDSVNIVFSNIFGSYHGDWDYEFDPLMPSALASRGGILTCSWAGRPHWFNQALASGETIGYCAKETMNAQLNAQYIPVQSKGGAHVSLLGDPTIRAHVIKPPSDLSLSNLNCEAVGLQWTASADSVAGYHIYRAPSQDGPYTRLTTELITGTAYTDINPGLDTFFYQVRAIQFVTTPGGGTYANNSIGPIKFIVFTQPASVANASVSGELNCANQEVLLESGSIDPNATYLWLPQTGLSCSNCPNPVATLPGTYVLLVSTGNCVAVDTVEVKKAPELLVNTGAVAAGCDGLGGACIEVSGGTPPYAILWSDGSTGPCASFASGQTMAVSVTDAGGCSFQSQPVVVQVPPALAVNISSTVDCSGTLEACAVINGGTPPYSILWSNGNTSSCAIFSNVTLVSLTATDASGCTKAVNVTISVPLPLSLSFVVTHESSQNANNGSVQLNVTGGTGVYTYHWSNGAFSKDINGLTAGVYTVTVTDANGCTATGSATVNTTSDTKEASVFRQFKLSPNPTTGLALLSLKLHASAGIQVELRDISGRLIVDFPEVQSNELDLPLNLSSYPDGIYTVSVWIDRQVFTRKLTVLR